MRKLVAFEFVSLDGFMAGPTGHEMDFVLAGFNNDMEKDLAEQYEAVDTFIMGRVTFQSLAGYWPTPAASGELLQEAMNTTEKLVCSSTMTEAEWSNSRILPANDVASEVKKIKSEPGKDIMIIGSASVVQSFTQERIIDEYRFFLFPIYLGAGKALFSNKAGLGPLKLLRTKNFETGVLRVDYARANEGDAR